MMRMWRIRAFPEPVNSGCSVTRHDGIDLDLWLAAKLDDWYYDLLRSAPPALLAPVEIASSLTVGILPDRSASVRIPDSVVRVLSIRLEGWMRPALVVSDPASRMAVLQRSVYSRGGVNAPVAVAFPGELRLYSVPDHMDSAVVASAMAVVHTPGTYHIDSAALATVVPLYA